MDHPGAAGAPGAPRTPPWRSIRFKMVRDLTLAALLPLLVFTLLSFRAARTSLETSAGENLTLLARVTATRLDQLLADGLNLADTLARDERVVRLCRAHADPQPALRDDVTRALAAAVQANATIAQATVLSQDGLGIASTDSADLGLDLSFRPYFKGAREGQRHVSDVLVGKTTRRPGVFFAVPVRDAPADAPAVARATRPIIGVLFVKYQGEKLWEIIDSAQVGRDGYALLIDEQGIILAHPRRDRVFRSLAPLSDQEQAQLDAPARYGVSRIEPAGLPQLWQAVRTSLTGTGALALPDPDSPGAPPQPFVVGHQRLSAKGWRVVAVEPEAQFAAGVLALRGRLLLTALIVAAIATLYALWRATRLVQPTLALTGAAERLAQGDFAARVPVRSSDELARLGSVFNTLGPRLKDQVELQRAMRVAVEVQDSLLPSKPPTVPGLQLAGKSIYCDATGGDYYDFLATKALGEGRVLLAVGDVMGHGIGSALLMASTRAALWAEVETTTNLADTLDRINRVLARDNRHHKFVTLQLLVLEPQARRATWASAGHDPAIVYDPATGAFTELEGAGVPLGIFDDATYEVYSHDNLPRACTIVIGTDGIWEAQNPQKELFGKDRLRALIAQHAAKPLADLASAIQRDVHAWRAGTPATDDVTYIVARLDAPPVT
jgi:sigma-B regulation protein RsbU (phosphoserine phosphatase)